MDVDNSMNGGGDGSSFNTMPINNSNTSPFGPMTQQPMNTGIATIGDHNNNSMHPFAGIAASPSATPNPTSPTNTHVPLIGMVASGYRMRTDFAPSDPTQTKFTLSLDSSVDLPSPLTQVHELAFFLLPNATLPPNTGIMIYWQLQLLHGGGPSSSGFELLGTLIPSTRPSGIFRTGWAEHDQFISITPPHQPARINIGISVEPIESVRNVEEHHNFTGQREQQVTATTAVVAHKIGQELFNYMRSFDTNGATGNQIIAVPANIFDKWWQRFERKLQRDPNFFLKNSNTD